MATLVVLAAFQGVFQAVSITLSRGLRYFSKISFQNEIHRLEKEKLKYQLKLKQLEGLSQENKTLRRALNLPEKKDLILIGTEIIAFSPSSWHRHIFVDAGKKRNVKESMLVIDENGYLLGKTIQVEQNHSKVILLRNPDFQTPVIVGKGVPGMLRGSLAGPEILYIEEEEKISVGDPVYAPFSSFDSFVKVGEITKIQKTRDSLFCSVDVKIFARDKLPQIVFIVK